MYDCTLHICSSHRSKKRMVDPLEPELQMVVSHDVGSGTQPQFLWKSNQCS